VKAASSVGNEWFSFPILHILYLTIEKGKVENLGGAKRILMILVNFGPNSKHHNIPYPSTPRRQNPNNPILCFFSIPQLDLQNQQQLRSMA
jgi:hypothetical protein